MHDTQILVALRSGNEAALVTFLQTNEQPLLAFIRSRIGTQLKRKIEPEDILQDASMEAVRVLGQTDLSSWDPLHWMFQLCERKIIDAHRRHFASQKRDASREAALPAGSEAAGLANLLAASMTTPSQAFSRDQRQLRTMAALETLPDDQREALRLRYLVGLPSKEIAKKFGKSDGAMRVMISRALSRLQALLVEE
ncbi:MAG: sigma-70 family RNA polymerase sigma factor [Planctomycetes bacterium]|nr:sigma-70 family RNA polymerase sigma factor [Planctomycetota bacterium]